MDNRNTRPALRSRLAVLLAVAAATMASPAVHAACPPAPVGKASDAVVQLVASGTTAGFGPTTALDATREGAVVYDSAAKTLKFCDGTNWVTFSSTTPSGAVMAFALTTCPAGWSEYTPARGRFLRGMDNGAGNDPDGTRAPGNAQADELKTHNHLVSGRDMPARASGSGAVYYIYSYGGDPGGSWEHHSNFSSSATGGAETRPKNVAVLFCRKD